MKNILTIGTLCLFGIFIACNNEADVQDDVSTLRFVADDFIFEDASGTPTKTGFSNTGGFHWTKKDTVGIYPNSGSQVYFEMTSGAGASNAEFDGGGWDFKPASIYYSYYPFIGDIYLDRNNIPVSYAGQKQTVLNGTDHIGPGDFMYTDPTQSADGKLHFTYHHLGCILRFNLTLPAGTYTKLALCASSNIFPVTGHFDLEADTPVIVPERYASQLQISLENITLASEGSTFITLMACPMGLTGAETTIRLLDTDKQEWKCTYTIPKDYEAGHGYNIAASSFELVPQSMGVIIDNWDEGASFSGEAE